MFDIGVNLTSRQFTGEEEAVIQRAQQAGVKGLLVTGTNLYESLQAQKLAKAFSSCCWSTCGVHPHDASQWNAGVAEALYDLSKQSQVVAWGECGLDFNRCFSTPEEQEQAFSAQLSIAAERGLPLFLHCRDAHDRFMTLLKPWLNKVPGAVLHCFTGQRHELQQILSIGLSVGITGWVCDERRGLALRALLPLIPSAQLMLETDAPYLMPRDILPKPKSRRNEPAFLPHIVQRVAEWRGEDPTELGQLTEYNAHRLLRLAV